MDFPSKNRAASGRNSSRCNSKNVVIHSRVMKAIALRIAIKIATKTYCHVSVCRLDRQTVSEWNLLTFLPFTVDHTRVKLIDIDPTVPGAEYINANYIRQPTEVDQCDMNSSSENLTSQLCPSCTVAQQQKNCQNCQLLNKTCVQCAMKSATLPLTGGSCANCGKKSDVSI